MTHYKYLITNNYTQWCIENKLYLEQDNKLIIVKDVKEYLIDLYHLSINDEIIHDGTELWILTKNRPVSEPELRSTALDVVPVQEFLKPDPHILFNVNTESDKIVMSRQEFDKLTLDIMDLGMDLRQNQLRQLTDKSGKDVLNQYLKENGY